MYYIVTDNGVLKSHSLKLLNKRYKTLVEGVEFRKIGADYILTATDKDMEFLQDKARIASIPLRNLYNRDTTRMMLIIILMLQFVATLGSCQAGI